MTSRNPSFPILLTGILLVSLPFTHESRAEEPNKDEYTVAAYYFPSYHPDPRREERRGKGWTEWELVKNAKPRFENHFQPKVPLWGYEDESDPKVMAKKIRVAAMHGIDVFIFDWYWYDGPFLSGGLDRGFLQAENNDQLRFALMWANHDWIDIFPRSVDQDPELIYPGLVSPATFEQVARHVIEKYFKHPSYWKIEGRPYFSFYDLSLLLKSFGGVQETRRALDRFREMAKHAGFPDLHLNIVMWGRTILPNEEIVENPSELVEALGFDSVTSYVWIHHVLLEQFPSTPYFQVLDKYMEYCREATNRYTVPYFPNATMGWDSSPRTNQSDRFVNIGYPFMPIMSGNTPEAFLQGLITVRDFLDRQERKGPKVVTLNCWNEWTEGSYLEPDTVNGLEYLEAIHKAFEEGVKYRDGRPSTDLRLEADDQGIVLRHGDGPDGCDRLGARDVVVFEAEGKFYMHYDGAGPRGWLSCLAVSDDLEHWEKKGPILDLGEPGEDDSASASYGVPFFDGHKWHLFYLGTPNTSPPPGRVPAFPYLTLKAEASSPTGPWVKQKQVVPFRPTPGTYYDTVASPGQTVQNQQGEYLQFFSASTHDGKVTKRTLGIARTRDLDGRWRVDEAPIVPLDEQIENSSLYYEPDNDTWFLFTNHVGVGQIEYTDAIWVYWSKDLETWNPEHKAVVLDSRNCSWSKGVIGLPSVLPVGNRLAIFYDGIEGDTKRHIGRDIGLAWLDLPLVPPSGE